MDEYRKHILGNIDEQNKYDSYGNIKPSYLDNKDKCWTKNKQ
jgi:hypothetical protein